jgi:predicted transport protein
MDHQGEFTLQVLRRLGQEYADNIDWSGPRLLCIAGDFTRYDEYAVLQIPRNIELLRYRRYGGDLLLLELVRASSTVPTQRRGGQIVKEKQSEAGIDAVAVEPPGAVQDLWEALKSFLLALGDDVQMKELEHYVAFRRMKNFACVKMHTKDLQIWARLDPNSVPLEEGFTRNVSDIGHAGTGDLEIRIRSTADLVRAQPLLVRSYQSA